MRTRAEEGIATRRAAGATGSADPARRRRRWIGCGALSLLAATAIWLALRDDPPPDDSDLLTPALVPVPVSETIVGGLIELAAELPVPVDWETEAYDHDPQGFVDPWAYRSLNREAWSDPALLERMRSHYEREGPVLDRVGEALGRRGRAWNPPDSFNTIVAGVTEVREFGWRLALRALWYRSSGDIAQASRDLDLALRLGEDLTASGCHSTLQGLMASHLHLTTIWRLESLLHDGDLDPMVASRILARRPVLESEPGIVARCLIGEYRLTRRMLDECSLRELGQFAGTSMRLPEFAYKMNRTITLLAQVFREFIAEIDRRPCERSFPIEDSTGSRDFRRRALLRMNAGEILLSEYCSGLRQTIQKFDRLCLAESALRLHLALRRYERTHGSLPADLDALRRGVPELACDLRDPYSCEPLRYDPARRIFWSVGPDGIDGDAAEWARLAEDPSLHRNELADTIWIVPRTPAAREGASAPR